MLGLQHTEALMKSHLILDYIFNGDNYSRLKIKFTRVRKPALTVRKSRQQTQPYILLCYHQIG